MTVTNINTMQLLNIINRTSAAQSKVLTQLSTGFKINKASDNPAGLIAMENFNAELTAVNAALDNNQRADAMLATAEAGFTEISSLLTEIETLAVASVNDSSLSQAEIQANQAQIDNALAAIDRISNTTTFNGKQLLNGAQAIQTTGVDTTKVDNLRVYSRGQSSSDVTVTVKLFTAATSAVGTFDMGAAALTAANEIVVTGELGPQSISLGTGLTQAQVVAAINTASAATGVDAVAGAENTVRLESSSTGSDAFVQMTVLSGADFSREDIARTEGVDAKVTVNGRLITADGKNVTYSANGLSIAFTVGASLDAAGETFTVKAAGGMTFQLGVDSTTRSTIGIDSVASHMLGDATTVVSELKSGGAADLASKTANTLKAVRGAITQVAAARGRIGGFQKFQVQTSINSLTQMQESLTAAKSVIADTDYATATAELNRQSVLLNAGVSLLGLANQQASQILSLLG